MIDFPPRPDEDDINFRINSSRNNLGYLAWADLGSILETLANERKSIYYPGRFYSVVFLTLSNFFPLLGFSLLRYSFFVTLFSNTPKWIRNLSRRIEKRISDIQVSCPKVVGIVDWNHRANCLSLRANICQVNRLSGETTVMLQIEVVLLFHDI